MRDSTGHCPVPSERALCNGQFAGRNSLQQSSEGHAKMGQTKWHIVSNSESSIIFSTKQSGQFWIENGLIVVVVKLNWRQFYYEKRNCVARKITMACHIFNNEGRRSTFMKRAVHSLWTVSGPRDCGTFFTEDIGDFELKMVIRWVCFMRLGMGLNISFLVTVTQKAEQVCSTPINIFSMIIIIRES